MRRERMGRGRLPGWSALLALLPCAALAQPCSGVVYLTFDTGNMRHAELIAETLRKHDVKATFFLANERTARGDYSLDASWGSYWKQRADEGHAFGSHTWRHGRIGPDTGDGHMKYRPAFGADEGRSVTLSPQDFCAELKRPDEALRAQTGRGLDAIWRAPGGRTTPAALDAARTCGYAHVRWAPAGFLGDELPSESYPNEALLAQALRNVRDGDVLMAHLGIWSRHDPFAPMIDPLIAGLKQRGMCFRTLREHPDYRAAQPPVALAAARAAR
ncbi:MAG: polysaccharide deacetylase family protein [Burkholderiaceae bacterium]|nr:polysaccharide deacetylase family protein [Burkholderiaceae bacterium]